mmetsp:Transcript_6244/g.16273  ORF Transcript_6244/g.16273 Transcript_6244/m.16273 type:complete len:210 (-) Transcript_6244:160-789(-)
MLPRILVVVAGVSGLMAPPAGLGRRVVLASEKGFGTPATKKATKNKPADMPSSPSSPLLQQLLEEEREKEAARARDIEDLKERDAFVRSTADAGRLPEVVANRMAARMAVLGGLPTFGGIGLFVFFYLSATKNDVAFQPTAVAAATTVPWVVGLLGIGYGALSASWDEDQDGSLIGVTEFKTNVGRIVDGLRRSANDAKLRDAIDDGDV